MATIACYANSFSGDFLFDDQSAIIDNASIRRPWDLVGIFTPPPDTTVSGRPIINATLALNYAVGGLQPFGYHLANLLIHTLAALVLFGIIRRTLRLEKLTHRFGRHADGLAFAIALLWAVHPLQTESVTYVVQRAESFAGLVYLSALYAFIRFLTAPSRKHWKWLPIGLCAFGMLCKETMATAPFVLLAYDLLLVSRESITATIKRRGLWYAALFSTIAIAIFILLTNPRGESAGFGNEELPTPLAYAMSEPGVILHYLRLTFWPTSLCLDYDWPVAESPSAILLPAAIIVALLIVTCAAALRRRPIAFLGVWFFGILLPTSSFVPIADLAFEHRMYLPLAAPIALVVLAIDRLVERCAESQRAKRAGLAGAAICGFAAAAALGLRTVDRNRDYSSAQAMWADVIAIRPENPRAYVNRAHSLYHKGDTDAAIAAYRRALEVDPEYSSALCSLGTILMQEGQMTAGLEALQKATEIAPNNPNYQYNLGTLFSKMGRDTDAVKAYEKCIALDPSYANAYYNLGNIALRQGDFEAAANRFTEALRIDPDNIRANYNLGGIYQNRGKQAEADRHFDRAFDAAMHVGRDMSNAGQPVEAVKALRLAVHVRPDDATAHYRLARELHVMGRMDEALQEAKAAVRLAPGMRAANDLVGTIESERHAAGIP